MRTASRNRVCSGLVLVGVIAAGSLFLRSRTDGRVRSGPPTEHALVALPGSAPSASAPPVLLAATVDRARGDDGPPLPGSLAGTDEDGALRVDEDGNLVVGPEVLRLFAYYFAASGEESEPTIRARIVRSIGTKLDGRAAARAVALLDEFVAYRGSARRMTSNGGDLQSRLAELRRLRQSHFGAADAEKLFGEDEGAAVAAIERQRVRADRTLSPEERSERLAAIEEQDAQRTLRAEVLKPVRELEEERAMRADGVSDEAMHAYRVASVGEAATERLEALDQRRAEWKRRLAAFDAARSALRNSEANPAVGDAKVEKLLEDSFTVEERPRVRAHDAIAGTD
jgi:lipase chaperone LimK